MSCRGCSGCGEDVPLYHVEGSPKPLCMRCGPAFTLEEADDDEARPVLDATKPLTLGVVEREQAFRRGPDMQAVRLRAGLPAQLPENPRVIAIETHLARLQEQAPQMTDMPQGGAE